MACGDVVAAPIGWGASVVTSEVRDARFGGLVVAAVVCRDGMHCASVGYAVRATPPRLSGPAVHRQDWVIGQARSGQAQAPTQLAHARCPE